MGANAQTTVPTFVTSQVLTADQQNQSARTGVPVFASTVTRDAAFGGTGEKTLAEGQLCYVEGTGLQTYNAAGSWVTWGAAPATGALVYITQGTFSGVSSVSMAAGTFTSTYENYKVILRVTSTSAHQAMSIRVNAAGSAQTGANYYGAWILAQSNGGVNAYATNALTYAIPIYIQSTTFAGLDITVYDPTNATTATRWSGTMSDGSDNNTHAGGAGGNVYTVAAAHDGLTFAVAGTFGGTYYVYGIKDS
jgi:hypothetical protein